MGSPQLQRHALVVVSGNTAATGLASPPMQRLKVAAAAASLPRAQLKRTQLQLNRIQLQRQGEVGGQSAAAGGLSSTQLKQQQGRLGALLGTAIEVRGPLPHMEGGGMVPTRRINPPRRRIPLISRCQLRRCQLSRVQLGRFQLSCFQLSRFQLRHHQRHCCQRHGATQSSSRSRSRSSRPDSSSPCLWKTPAAGSGAGGPCVPTWAGQWAMHFWIHGAQTPR